MVLIIGFFVVSTISQVNSQQVLENGPNYKGFYNEYTKEYYKIFTIAISADEESKSTNYFTVESLKESIPFLWPAHILLNWCENASKQKGVIVLENKDVIFWHSCKKDFIVFEGKTYGGSYSFAKEANW